jgi:hypothetical protein
LVTIDLRPIIAYHIYKIFLAMKGTAAPLQTPKQKGAHPPSGNPLMYLLNGGGAEKVITFLTTFLKRKTVFGV